VKEALYGLEKMTPGTDEYDELLNKTMKDIREHAEELEREDLQLLEPLLGLDGSKKAAASFSSTKKFVPTRCDSHLNLPCDDLTFLNHRPHPSTSNNAPYETVVGFLTTPIDKLKDMFTKFPTEEMKQEAQKDV
jgi:hypothetical protein